MRVKLSKAARLANLDASQRLDKLALWERSIFDTATTFSVVRMTGRGSRTDVYRGDDFQAALAAAEPEERACLYATSSQGTIMLGNRGTIVLDRKLWRYWARRYQIIHGEIPSPGTKVTKR